MKIERVTRSAPSSCFSGGHTVQHRVVSDDRQWMPDMALAWWLALPCFIIGLWAWSL